MKRSILTIPVVFVLGFIALQANGQNLGDYRSNTILGNWSSASSWQRFNGTAWITASTYPTSADGVITILSNHAISISSAITIDQVIVAGGGLLSIATIGPSFTATLANGTGNDMEVYGTLEVSTNATLTGPGNLVNNTGGTFYVRNTGTLSANAVNNGAMQVSGYGTFANNTVINYANFSLLNLSLSLNNATFTNRGQMTFESLLDSSVTGTGGGIFINETDGTLYKTSLSGTAFIDPAPGTVTVTNRGVIKGIGQFVFRSTALNTGLVTPGNNNAGILGVNPAFVTGKAPTFMVDIISSGFIAGINFDQVIFSSNDATTIDISGSTLNVSDNGNDAIGTEYIIFSSLSNIVGTFATVNLPPTLGTPTYNATSITVRKIASQARYMWVGGSNGAWSVPANWWPARNVPSPNDILTFSSATTVTITDVPTETISAINITNNTTVNLQAAGNSKNLTVGNGFMNYLNIDPGSTLQVLSNGSVLLNIFIATGSRAVIGGVANMQNGTFNIGDNNLLLHTTAAPLQRVNGQFAIGANGSIEFGDALRTSGPAITLPNYIFIAPPVIASITVRRTNGVMLGNQAVTVNQANMLLGNLTTNAAAPILFLPSAINPLEIPISKIIGYAELMPRMIGSTALNFLGVLSPAGSNIGTVSVTRITGSAGINTFNGFTSIASTWNISASAEPSPARSIAFAWLSDFDNGANTALQFQDYRYDVGPGWVAVGGLAALQSTANPRVTTATLTLKFSGSWSISDQLNVLPIVLGEFTARKVNETVVLDWKTVSELNADYFEVQRRGEKEETFTIVGTVRAHGTTNQKNQYSFTDLVPVSGRNYYRLRLVDLDQTYDYSPVRSVLVEPGAYFSLYPNPGNGTQVTLRFAEAVNGRITISDMAQREIVTLTVSGTPADRVVLSDLALATGAYLVLFESGVQRIVRRLLVQP